MSATAELLLLACLACLLCALAVAIVLKIRITPEEKERRRRIRVNLLGRLHDGMLADVQGDIIYYFYSVSGVDYNTSQDISGLRKLVPQDAALYIGPVNLKYLVRNPGNSIVVCEHWSGLRIRPKHAYSPVAPIPEPDSPW